MKIKYFSGCDMGIEINSKNFYELSNEEQKNLLHKIIDKSSEDIMFDMIVDACEYMGNYEDLGYCETCGSYNCEYTLEI